MLLLVASPPLALGAKNNPFSPNFSLVNMCVCVCLCYAEEALSFLMSVVWFESVGPMENGWAGKSNQGPIDRVAHMTADVIWSAIHRACRHK